MLAEVLRLTTQWLAGSTYGVNAQLVAMTYDGSDTAPAPLYAVHDEVTTEDAALVRIPTTLPAALVTVDVATMQQNEAVPEVGDGSITLTIRIATEERADAATSKLEASYYLRALAWCLRAWVRADSSGTTRVRNGVQILEIGPMEFNALHERIEERLISAGARLTLVVRDVGPT